MKIYWLWLVLLSILTACGNPTAAPPLPPTPIPPTAVPTVASVPSATPQPTLTTPPTATLQPTRVAPPTPTSAADDLPGRAAPDEGAKHTEVGAVIAYKNSPPSSGTHYPQWLKYGVYAQPIPPGYWVHNLEHGAVVVLFKCETNCQDIATQVLKVSQGMRPGKYGEVKLLGIPYNDMPNDFAVVAWGRVDDLDSLDVARIQKFYEAFVDQGPEDVP